MSEKTEARLVKLEEKIDKLLDKAKRVDELHRDFNHNMQVLHGDIKDLCRRLDESEKKYKEVKKTVATLEAENRMLGNDVKSLRQSLEDCCYNMSANEMEVVGVPPGSVENLRNVILNIARKIDVDMSEADIKSVSRVSNKKGLLHVIKVVFSDREKCGLFIEKGRKARLTGENIGFLGVKSNVFFNEFLSPFSKMLLFNARAFKRQEEWKYVWARGGKIFVRKADKEPAIRISSLADLEVLKNPSK